MHILPGLQWSPVISLRQLCEDDCEVLLNKNSLFVVKGNELIIEDFQNKRDYGTLSAKARPSTVKTFHAVTTYRLILYVQQNTKKANIQDYSRQFWNFFPQTLLWGNI